MNWEGYEVEGQMDISEFLDKGENMKVIKASYEIIDQLDGQAILEKIEKIARVCYKSEDKITEGSAERMVRSLIKSKHEAMLEHFSFSVKFTVDRGISHEIVRHRMASFAQESTRYCNYGKSGDVTFIRPCYWEEDSPQMGIWEDICEHSEKAYNKLVIKNLVDEIAFDIVAPQEARAVLPTSLKTEIVMSANLREWRHFFKLRAEGTTGKPHPQMLEVTIPLLKELQERIPVVFDDIGGK